MNFWISPLFTTHRVVVSCAAAIDKVKHRADDVTDSKEQPYSHIVVHDNDDDSNRK